MIFKKKKKIKWLERINSKRYEIGPARNVAAGENFISPTPSSPSLVLNFFLNRQIDISSNQTAVKVKGNNNNNNKFLIGKISFRSDSDLKYFTENVNIKMPASQRFHLLPTVFYFFYILFFLFFCLFASLFLPPPLLQIANVPEIYFAFLWTILYSLDFFTFPPS